MIIVFKKLFRDAEKMKGVITLTKMMMGGDWVVKWQHLFSDQLQLVA